MNLRQCLLLSFLLAIAGCAGRGPFNYPNAAGYASPEVISCVPYARKVSGVALYGDADGWWRQAEGKYARGSTPAPGAILVLKATPRMRSGHVAVVKGVTNARQIRVTHSNWGENRKRRHNIYESMLAEDASPANDWSQIRFWNEEKNAMGFPYSAYGFIYP